MTTVTFSISANGNDGSGFYHNDATWPPDGGTWTDEPGDTLFVSKGQSVTSLFYSDEVFLRFDTSSIPASATIDAATIKVWVLAKGDDGVTFGLVGDYYDFGGEPTVAADWLETASPSIFAAVDITGITVGAVLSLPLTNLTGIMRSGETNGQGFTGFTGIRFTITAGTPDPNDDNSVNFAALEHATQVEPQLEVTYTAATETQTRRYQIRRSRMTSW